MGRGTERQLPRGVGPRLVEGENHLARLRLRLEGGNGEGVLEVRIAKRRNPGGNGASVQQKEQGRRVTPLGEGEWEAAFRVFGENAFRQEEPVLQQVPPIVQREAHERRGIAVVATPHPIIPLPT